MTFGSKDAPTLLLFDDRELATGNVARVLGDRRFGDVIYRRRSLASRMAELASGMSYLEFKRVRHDGEFEAALQAATQREQDILYWSAALTSHARERLEHVIRTLVLARERARLSVKHGAAVVFFPAGTNVPPLIASARSGLAGGDAFARVPAPEELVDLSQYRDCLLFFSGSSEPRFFNNLSVSDYQVAKRSRNVEKMRAEHDFYYLLPNSFRHWFVAPFMFEEREGEAGYRMERLYIPDMAVQWVHESLTGQEFDTFVDDVGRFLTSRPSHTELPDVVAKAAHRHFKQKVEERFQRLQQDQRSERINNLVRSGTRFDGLEEVLQHYLTLYGRHAARFAKFPSLVIGHGDPCLSNILYEKSIRLLRLIDPLGAVEEKQLWHHPYYDWAKLSHSILGDYDWINNDLYSIDLAPGNNLIVSIHVEDRDGLEAKKQCFLSQVTAAGVDPFLMRLGEASLFLSMAPLHLDHERKVLAFVLRSVGILEELELNEHA